MTVNSALDLDELADAICTWAGRVAAGTAHLLGLVAEFDRREGWAGTGLLSCAHWLSWKIGLSPGTAREYVRVARRLEDLPEIAQAFAAGRMSWSQVRAVTRVAEPDDGVDWVDLARHSSAAQLEQLVRGVRRARSVAEAAADPEAAAWKLRTRERYDDNGNLALTIYAPAELAPIVLAGIEAQRAELDRQRESKVAVAEPAPATEPAGPEEPATSVGAERPDDVPAGTPEPLRSVPTDVPPGWPEGTTPEEASAAMEGLARFCSSYSEESDVGGDVPAGTPPVVAASTSLPAPALEPEPATPPRATDAEALVALAQQALDRQAVEQPAVARRTRARLIAQVDPLSGWARLADGELLPPSSLKQVLKSLPGRGGTLRLRPVTEADRRRHDLGRRQRDVSLPLRELLGVMDGERCRFPGCTRRRKLHAHHVVFWSRGGLTDLSNLVLVCSRHHTLIHSQGFELLLHPDRRLEVRTAEGVVLLHHPALPWGEPAALDPHGRVGATTLPPETYERLDLGYAVSVLMQQAA